MASHRCSSCIPDKCRSAAVPFASRSDRSATPIIQYGAAPGQHEPAFSCDGSVNE